MNRKKQHRLLLLLSFGMFGCISLMGMEKTGKNRPILYNATPTEKIEILFLDDAEMLEYMSWKKLCEDIRDSNQKKKTLSEIEIKELNRLEQESIKALAEKKSFPLKEKIRWYHLQSKSPNTLRLKLPFLEECISSLVKMYVNEHEKFLAFVKSYIDEQNKSLI